MDKTKYVVVCPIRRSIIKEIKIRRMEELHELIIKHNNNNTDNALSTRIFKSVINVGITSVDDIIMYGKSAFVSLLSIKGIGEGKMQQIWKSVLIDIFKTQKDCRNCGYPHKLAGKCYSCYDYSQWIPIEDDKKSEEQTNDKL